MKVPPAPSEYVAAIVNVSFGGLLFWCILHSAERLWPNRGRRIVLASVCTFSCTVVAVSAGVKCVNLIPGVRHALLSTPVSSHTLLSGFSLFVIVVALCLKFHRRLIKIATSTFLILSPFICVTYSWAAWKAVTYNDAEFRDNLPTARFNARPERRAVWIVFDEWDHGATISHRPFGLRMAELDRFRQQAIEFGDAVPAGHETSTSIPSMLTGLRYGRSIPSGPRALTLELAGTLQRTTFKAEQNVFAELSSRGKNGAIVGWYLPYCRMLGSVVTGCESFPRLLPPNSAGPGIPAIALGQVRSLIETVNFSPFPQSLAARAHAETYQRILSAAKRIVSDDRIAIAFIHFSVPHAPFIYNRRTGAFDLRHSPQSGYIDALALVDRTLGEIRAAMEKAGTWDTSAVLLTADHPLRDFVLENVPPAWRVPYFLKLPGKQHAEYVPVKFDTVRTKDLLMAAIQGELREPSDVTRWVRPLNLQSTRLNGNPRAPQRCQTF